MNSKQRRKRIRDYVKFCKRTVAPLLQQAADLVLIGSKDEAHKQLEEAVVNIARMK